MNVKVFIARAGAEAQGGHGGGPGVGRARAHAGPGRGAGAGSVPPAALSKLLLNRDLIAEPHVTNQFVNN